MRISKWTLLSRNSHTNETSEEPGTDNNYY